jgi:hypothetical protein
MKHSSGTAKSRLHGKQDVRSRFILDNWFTGSVILVAVAAAALPWYVFLNPEKFGINGAGWEALRNLPQGHGGGVNAVIPHEQQQAADSEQPLEDQFDPIVTATVPKLGPESETGAELLEQQPFPGGTRFRLLHVANGRALIEDKSGMFMVQIGSILPDNSRLVRLQRTRGRWEIITSAGEIYQE